MLLLLLLLFVSVSSVLAPFNHRRITLRSSSHHESVAARTVPRCCCHADEWYIAPPIHKCSADNHLSFPVLPSQAIIHQGHSPGEKNIGKPQVFPFAELFRELVVVLNEKMYDFGEWLLSRNASHLPLLVQRFPLTIFSINQFLKHKKKIASSGRYTPPPPSSTAPAGPVTP